MVFRNKTRNQKSDLQEIFSVTSVCFLDFVGRIQKKKQNKKQTEI